nr:hypothetical protein [Treponema putidum]
MDLLATGRIRGTFGVEGFVKVESFSGEYGHFLLFDRVFLSIPQEKLKEQKYKDGWFEIEEVNLRKADALVKFKGIDNPEAAKSLTGSELFIPRDKAAPPSTRAKFMSMIFVIVILYAKELLLEK